MSKIVALPAAPAAIRLLEGAIESRRQEALLKTGALQDAIFNSANFSSIATDANGVIQIFNVGAERMLGYTAAEVMNKITPADISDPQEVIARAKALSVELATPITPGFEALVFKASRGIEDIYELTYIRKDGSRFPAIVSVTALRDAKKAIIGYLLIGTDNTARNQIKHALQESEERYATLFNTMLEGFCIIEVLFDADGKAIDYRFLETNKAFEAQTGLLNAKGKRMRELAPAHEEYWFELYGKVALTGEPALFVNEAKALNRWYEVSAHRFGDGSSRNVSILFQDITARKQTEAALLKAGALQSAILTSAVFSIIATDAKGIIQLFNVGAERMLGYAAAEVVNKINPSDIHDPAEVMARAQSLSLELATPITPGFEALAFKASRGIADIYELTYIRKDGSRFPAIVSITALRADYGEIIGYLLIGTDNSVRKQVEAELTNAKAVAEKASLAKSDFLSNMSHELRSPLNAILGFAQLMESDAVPQTATQKESTGQILQAGWYLLDLINEILDLALIESGKLMLSKEPMSLDEVMRDCQAMIEPQAQKYGITVKFCHFDEPCFVRADRTRVKQILINLLSNSIKYNHAGGSVIVDCSVGSVERIRISIRDTGPGLAADKLAQLFQPFNRLGQENSSEEGTGIGLVMTKRLVELMGGEIGVESTVGKGSVFWVELLRAAKPELAVDVPAAAAPAATNRHDSTLRTLLYVEDNPANLRLVEQLIARRPNLRLLSAVNATLGIELARNHQPDVILMDINLPGISGIRALKILREDPLTQRIPVVAISANAMPHDIRRGLDAGFFRYLTKPIKVDAFMEALDVALDYSSLASGAGVSGKKAQ